MNYYFTHFDRLFEEFTGNDYLKPLHEVAKEQNTIKLPSFPPCDCIVSDDRNTLGLRLAMAGYEKEDVSVTASEGSITVSAQARMTDVVGKVWGEGFESIHQGISRKPVNITVAIDENYNAREATTSFKNGMLFLELPIKKDAKSVKLM